MPDSGSATNIGAIQVPFTVDATGAEAGAARGAAALDKLEARSKKAQDNLTKASEALAKAQQEAAELGSDATEKGAERVARALEKAQTKADEAASKVATAGQKLAAAQQKAMEQAAAATDKGAEQVAAGIDRLAAKTAAAGGSVAAAMAKMEKSIKDSLDRSSGNLKKFTDGAAFALVGQKFMQAGKQMESGILAAMKPAEDFDLKMRYVNTSLGLGEEAFKSYEKQVLDLSNSMPNATKDAAEMADGLYPIVGAGFEGARALATLKQATLMATAGMTEIKPAADLLTTVMTSYKLGADKAGVAADILSAAVAKGKVTFSEMAAALGPAAVKSAAYGISLEELVSGFVVLTQHGVKAAEATTVLERTMMSIVAPTAKQQALMDSLGVAYGRSAVEGGHFGDSLTKLVSLAATDSEVRKMVGSIEALTGVQTLATQGGQEFRDMLDRLSHSAGTTTAMADEMAKSSSEQWKMLRKDFDNAAISMKETLLPQMDGVATAGRGIIKTFNDLSPQMKSFVIVGAEVGAAVAIVAGGIVLATGAVMALMPALTTVGGALAAFGGSAFLPVTLAIAGVGLAVVALKAAWDNNFLGMRETVHKWSDDVTQTMQGMHELFPSMFPQAAMVEADDQHGKDLHDVRAATQGRGLPSVSFSKGDSSATDTRVLMSDKEKADRDAAQAMRDLATSAKDLGKILGGGAKSGSRGSRGGGGSVANDDAALRAQLVSAAESMVGTPLSQIKDAAGNLGSSANKCADTVRAIGDRAGIKYGVASPRNAVDGAAVTAAGMGIGPDHADSFPGREIPASQVRAGDLVMFKDTSRQYSGTGMVTHVGIVIDPVKGMMVDASSSQGNVVKRSISDIGPDKLFGFVRPEAMEKGGHGGSGVQSYESMAKELASARSIVDKYLGKDSGFQGQRDAENASYAKAVSAAHSSGKDDQATLDELLAKHLQILAEIDEKKSQYNQKQANEESKIIGRLAQMQMEAEGRTGQLAQIRAKVHFDERMAEINEIERKYKADPNMMAAAGEAKTAITAGYKSDTEEANQKDKDDKAKAIRELEVMQAESSGRVGQIELLRVKEHYDAEMARIAAIERAQPDLHGQAESAKASATTAYKDDSQDAVAKAKMADVEFQTKTNQITKQQALQLQADILAADTSTSNARREMMLKAAEEYKADLEQKLTLQGAYNIANLQHEMERLNGIRELTMQDQLKMMALKMAQHDLQAQQDQQDAANRQQLLQQGEQALTTFFQAVTTGHQTFATAFKSMWQSISSMVVGEIEKMIAKMLVYRALMFITGLFTGGASTAAMGAIDAAGSGLGGGLLTAHTGGLIVPGGLRSFHSGGPVSLKPDEVVAKLQVGEYVMSRGQVAQAQQAATSNSNNRSSSVTNHNQFALYPSSSTDLNALQANIAMLMESQMKGAYK